MIHYVFDLDDTLILHTKGVPINYEAIPADGELSAMLQRCKGPCYIYTNGTGGHALDIIEKMNIYHDFEKIYSRDTIPYMKPDLRSFNDVQDDISLRDPSPKQIFFFDDLLENLQTAHDLGWITFWIHPQARGYMSHSFVNMGFINIKECLSYLETKY
tara:strand:+ start:68 stop:541 length:474 start_codon:yes stop_codon:yes gene_type:complete